MKLEQSFTVEAAVQDVWAALIDVQRVAPCLPGAEITDAADDGSYKGTFTVKLGPTTAVYNGTLKLESLDESARVATMSARGTDKRGKGGASATIVSTLHDGGGTTRVDVATDFTITGRLASFGRSGMIQDISNRLLRDFAGCLQETIGAAPVAATAAVTGGTPPIDDPAADPASGAAPPQPEPAAPDTPIGPPGETPSAPAPAPPPPPRAAAPPPPPRPAKPISGFRLILGALRDRLARLFGRGGR
jgi:carbon monoxide dehydrogenase subunit G